MSKEQVKAAFSKCPIVAECNFDDWTLIYIGGQLFHWHDNIDGVELLARLGVPQDDSIPDADSIKAALTAINPDHWEEGMPQTLDELKQIVFDYESSQKKARVAELRAEADRLEAEAV